MAIKLNADKQAIRAILAEDEYIKERGFTLEEMYCVRATDELLGVYDKKNKLKSQIFIYNADPFSTINPIIRGVVYEVAVSVPYTKNGTADLVMEQIIALLDGTEILNVHQLELLDAPVILSSETSLYQIGCRFVCYVSKYTKKKTL